MGRLISEKYAAWKDECEARFRQLKKNEEELNRVKNQFTAGQTVTLTIYRSGSSYDVEIILMDRANA